MKRSTAIISLILLFAALGLAQTRGARTVKYATQDIVPIRAKTRFTSLIVLPANEKILDFVVGDKDFWVVEGIENFCYVKPAKQGSTTNLTLITAAGNVYSLLLTEIGDATDPDLKVFIEPTDNTMLQAIKGPPKFLPATEVDVAKAASRQETSKAQQAEDTFRSQYPITGLQFDYRFKHDEKPFLVTAIYHDDKFTYIRSTAQEKPALYEVKDGAPNQINFDLQNGVYVIPKILDKGYLVIGKHRLDFERTN
jgi:type IV secretory pathway VirB9-like protein